MIPDYLTFIRRQDRSFSRIFILFVYYLLRYMLKIEGIC